MTPDIVGFVPRAVFCSTHARVLHRFVGDLEKAHITSEQVSKGFCALLIVLFSFSLCISLQTSKHSTSALLAHFVPCQIILPHRLRACSLPHASLARYGCEEAKECYRHMRQICVMRLACNAVPDPASCCTRLRLWPMDSLDCNAVASPCKESSCNTSASPRIWRMVQVIG